MSNLRGIGWDHPRCRLPLEAAATAWAHHGNDAVEWDFRPLEAFNDQPIAELVAEHDLLVVDHPHVPGAAEAGLLQPLGELLGEDTLARLRGDSLGPSFDSYSYAERQWALPIDAACQVAAYRPDLLANPPSTWPEVLALARNRPGSVALPLTPADALCSLLSLCAQLDAPVDVDGGGPTFDRRAVELLVEVVALADRRSFSCSPPHLLRELQGDRSLCYLPLTFGYTDFSRPGTKRLLRYARPPGASAVLGGAGIAVSAASSQAESAAAFSAWLADPETQRSVVLPAGGQPASASVWLDPVADAAVGGFFSATRPAIEAAYVRPRHPRWPAFHDRAGRALAEDLAAGEGIEEILNCLHAAASVLGEP